DRRALRRDRWPSALPFFSSGTRAQAAPWPSHVRPRCKPSPATAPGVANCHSRRYAKSGSRQVAWQLALEFRKITGDHSDVETPKDRLLGLAIKQELERRLDATLRRVRTHRQSFASRSCHRDVMTRLAVSDTEDDVEFEWIAFAGSLDLDHRLPL